jgi:alpha-ketoglutarate-dependent taurine dioxygenase
MKKFLSTHNQYGPKSPFSLEDKAAYLAWRTEKLANYSDHLQNLIVPIKDPCHLTEQEYAEILIRCRKTNLAIYQIANQQRVDKPALHALASQLGLCKLDHNLCADEDGIAALQVAPKGRSQEYIPYTNRAINWHTDGYYNTPVEQVQAILMHCAQPALTGGKNGFLDHEIAYIQLRDENPDYIAALMAADVMTIPANVEDGVEVRPAQTGPVFSVNPLTGALQMRYTARTRSIVWKQNPTTIAALDCLSSFLSGDSPYILWHKLAPNQGVLCNNILHNRTGFMDGTAEGEQRLLYRMRFYDRIND